MISKIKFNNLQGNNIGLGNVKLKDSGGTELPSTNLSALASSDDGSNLPANVLDYDMAMNALWTFTGHADSVMAVAIDSEGNIYSGGADNTVKKINPDGTEAWTFTGHTNRVVALAVDSEGNIYSGSDDYTVRKINPDGTEAWAFTGHTHNVYALTVDSEGNVYSGSWDKTVKKINPDGTEAWTFTGHTHYVTALAVDSEGNIYSCSYDRTVKKIKPDGTVTWTFEGHTSPVYALAVDSEGNIYSGGQDKTVKKINPDGTEAWTFTGHTSYVYALAVDSEGNIYSGGSDKTVKKINPDGTESWTFTGHTSGVYAVAVDSEGNIFSGGADDTVKKINPTPTSSYWQNDGAEESSYLEVSLNSAQDLSEVSFIPKPTDTVGPTKPLDIEVYDESDNLILANKIEPVTNTMAYQSYDPTVDTTGDLVKTVSFEGLKSSANVGMANIKLNDSKQRELGISLMNPLATSEDEINIDNNVLDYDMAINTLWTFEGHTNTVYALAVDSEGNIFSGSTDRTVKKINPDGTEAWTFTGHTDYVYEVAVDSEGNVYSGSTDGTVKKINPDGTPGWTFEGHTSYVWALTVDSGGNIYSGSYREVKKINPDGTEAWTFEGHTHFVNALAVDSEGNIYSGSDDSTVKKISPDGTEAWTFTGHTNNVEAVAVDSEGNVYSGGSDDTVKKINPDGTEAWTFTGHAGTVYALAVDSEGNIYSGSQDKTVRKLNPDGTEAWTFTGHTSNVFALTMDSEGNIYSGSNTVKKLTEAFSYWQNNGAETESQLDITLATPQPIDTVNFMPAAASDVKIDEPFYIRFYDENSTMLKEILVNPISDTQTYQTIAYLLEILIKGDDGTGTFVKGVELTPGANQDIKITVNGAASSHMIDKILVEGINDIKYWYAETDGTPTSVANNGEEVTTIDLPSDLNNGTTITMTCAVELEDTGDFTITPSMTRVRAGEPVDFEFQLGTGEYKKYDGVIQLDTPIEFTGDGEQTINITVPTDLFTELKTMNINGNVVNVNKDVKVKLK